MKALRRSWVVWYALLLAMVYLAALGIYSFFDISRFPSLTLLTFATTATLIIALASTNNHEYESSKNMKMLRWLFNTKLSKSIQYFTVTVFATVLIFAVLRELLPNTLLITVMDAVINIVVWIMLFSLLYWIIYATGKSRV